MAGRPLTHDGEAEERAVQAQSMRALLEASDRREIACYRALDRRIDAALDDLDSGRAPYRALREIDAIVDELERIDPGENAVHAEVRPDAVLLGGVA